MLGFAAAAWGFLLGNIADSFGEGDAFSTWAIHASIPLALLNLLAFGAAVPLARGVRWAFWLTLGTAVAGLLAVHWWYIPAAAVQGLAVVASGVRSGEPARPRGFTSPSSKP
ncbi:MAG: hypothetical protein ACPGQL_09545 [Thermoplasmatota archaeon]